MIKLWLVGLLLGVLTTEIYAESLASRKRSETIVRTETDDLITVYATEVKIPHNDDLECISDLDYSHTSWHNLSWDERSVYKHVKLKFETVEGTRVNGTIYGTKKIEKLNLPECN